MNSENYIDSLKKFNEAQKREITPFSECERVLGDTAKVSAFAQFWDKHHDEFLIIGAKELFEFSTTQEYTKHELDIFKKGLSAIGSFFENCSRDIAGKKALEESKMSAQVSETGASEI